MSIIRDIMNTYGQPPTEGPPVPETPAPINSAELSAAIIELRESFSRGLGEGFAQLSAALAPGQNVIPLGSESFTVNTHRVMAGQSQQVLGSDETRTKATVMALEAGIFIYNEDGLTPVTADDYRGAQLPVNVPIELDTRAAIFAAALPGSNDALLVVFSQSANFYVKPNS